jgi:protoheme IX farnesyltransferase
VFTTKYSMSLRHPTENEISLTPTFSPFDKAQGRRWNGRGRFDPKSNGSRSLRYYPRPLCGRGKGEGAGAIVLANPKVQLSRVSDFVALTKPEITFLVLLATAVGSTMASASVNLVSLFHALFGTALVASGAAALNQYLERFHDATMRRTANRPLPAGRLSPREALYFGTGLSASGTLYLALSMNALTSMIGLIALLSYLLVYTPLKRRTHLCTLIGAFPGAAPVLMGWSASQGTLAPQAWLLYATLFLWQFPHFLAIAWLYHEDYAQAGMLMLPSEDDNRGSSFRTMWVTSIGLVSTTLVPSLIGMTGKIYSHAALWLGLGLLFFVYRVSSRPSKNAARQLLKATVIYLPLLYLVMILDKAVFPK